MTYDPSQTVTLNMAKHEHNYSSCIRFLHTLIDSHTHIEMSAVKAIADIQNARPSHEPLTAHKKGLIIGYSIQYRHSESRFV